MKDSDLIHWAKANGLLRLGESIEDSVKRKDILEVFYRFIHNTVYEVNEDEANYTKEVENEDYTI